VLKLDNTEIVNLIKNCDALVEQSETMTRSIFLSGKTDYELDLVDISVFDVPDGIYRIERLYSKRVLNVYVDLYLFYTHKVHVYISDVEINMDIEDIRFHIISDRLMQTKTETVDFTYISDYPFNNLNYIYLDIDLTGYTFLFGNYSEELYSSFILHSNKNALYFDNFPLNEDTYADVVLKNHVCCSSTLTVKCKLDYEDLLDFLAYAYEEYCAERISITVKDDTDNEYILKKMVTVMEYFKKNVKTKFGVSGDALPIIYFIKHSKINPELYERIALPAVYKLVKSYFNMYVHDRY
jgi:hypothetical protein